MLGPNLATCQLATWAENAVKFELKISNKNGRGNQTKMRWEWIGIYNKNDMECGKCKRKLNSDMRSCGEAGA